MKTKTLLSKKSFFRKIYLRITWLYRDTDWWIRQEIYRWKFWFQIRKYYMAPWDVTDAIFHINFQMLLAFWKGNVERHKEMQFGNETEEDAKKRYEELQSIVDYYTTERNVLNQQIEDAKTNLYKQYPRIFSFEATDETEEFYYMKSTPEETKEEKAEWHRIFDLEDYVYKRDIEALNVLIKYHKCFWD